MESRRNQGTEAARLLALFRDDCLVSQTCLRPIVRRFLRCTVFSILIPWFTVREVPVEVEIPSPKVAIIRFERGLQQGLLARISRSSLLEYHTFGTISEGKHAKHHYLICGVQGDFTEELVNNPPTSLWTRQLKVSDIWNDGIVWITRSLASSLLASQTPLPSTNGASGSALVLVSVPLSQLVSRMTVGSWSGSVPTSRKPSELPSLPSSTKISLRNACVCGTLRNGEEDLTLYDLWHRSTRSGMLRLCSLPQTWVGTGS